MNAERVPQSMVSDDQGKEESTAPSTAAVSKHIRWLGLGLFGYALVVIVIFVMVLPKSPPNAEQVLRANAYAERLERQALRLDSLAGAVRKGPDSSTNFARTLDSTAKHWRLSAIDARSLADTIERSALNPQDTREAITFVKWKVADHLSFEWRLILVALFAGMIGSFIHAAVSFSTYVGNRSFAISWTWWYTLRPLIGGALALVVYLVFRGALVSGSAVDTLNAYGVAGLAALSGMFSKQAIDKLDEVFTVLFKPGTNSGDNVRKDKAVPVPTSAPLPSTQAGGVTTLLPSSTPPLITRIDPREVPAGSTTIRLKVAGSAFTAGVKVEVSSKSAKRVATPLSVAADELVIELSEAELSLTGTLEIVVVGPNGERSSPASMTIA